MVLKCCPSLYRITCMRWLSRSLTTTLPWWSNAAQNGRLNCPLPEPLLPKARWKPAPTAVTAPTARDRTAAAKPFTTIRPNRLTLKRLAPLPPPAAAAAATASNLPPPQPSSGIRTVTAIRKQRHASLPATAASGDAAAISTSASSCACSSSLPSSSPTHARCSSTFSSSASSRIA